jgi:hypothetical protein
MVLLRMLELRTNRLGTRRFSFNVPELFEILGMAIAKLRFPVMVLKSNRPLGPGF